MTMYIFGMADTAASYYNSFDNSIISDNSEYKISGTITKTTEKENSQQIFMERAVVSAGDTVCGYTGILISNYSENRLQMGDYLEIHSPLEVIEHAMNPGEFDAAYYYMSSNIYYRAKWDGVTFIRKSSNVYYNILADIKSHIRAAYLSIADRELAGVCMSMVIADKSYLSEDISSAFKKNGIAHILAISGLHISLIGMTIYKLMRKAGINFFISAAVSSFIMVSYGILTGNSISTIRAVVMFIVTVYAQVFGRTYDMISAMCLSLIAVVLRYPFSIYNSQVYLSYGAIIGIAVVTPAVKRLVCTKARFMEALIVSFSVTLVTFPVIINIYYEYPVYSILLNLVVVPLMGMFMVSAVLAGVVGSISEAAGLFLIGPADFILRVYMKLCDFTGRLPGSVIKTGALSDRKLFMYYAALLVVIISAYAIKRRKACILTLVFFIYVSVLLNIKNKGMEITMLYVGQGDCMYISTGNFNMLIDGGSSSKKNIGSNVIIPFLNYKGVSKIDYVVLTHADSDHYSGLTELFLEENIHINKFLMAGIEKKDEAYEKLYDMAQKYTDAGIILRGDTIEYGRLKIVCLHPYTDYNWSDANDYSVSFLISYGDFDMVTTGDLEKTGENEIIKYNEIRNIDVLKCGHHGSDTSSGKEWLDMLRPHIALISCGKNNSYGHPHKEVLERLDGCGADIYTGFNTGAVRIRTDGRNIEIEKYNKCQNVNN